MGRPDLTTREAAIRVVQELREAGHEALLAGGCVRDRLLGYEPKDYDVATDAPPNIVQSIFRRTQAVGEAFGVVLVVIGSHRIEVATFRVESDYQDGRRPTQVAFTDAKTDAQRRDFTINGLFEDPLAPAGERIIDYVQGQADLEAGIVRAIGDAPQRFAEDYLRMLRAPRFAARLGFQIADTTAAAIKVHAPQLSKIARERIGQEMRAMLLGPNADKAAAMVEQLQLDAPALNDVHHKHSLHVLAAFVDTDGDMEVEQVLDDDHVYGAVLTAWMLNREMNMAHFQCEQRSLIDQHPHANDRRSANNVHSASEDERRSPKSNHHEPSNELCSAPGDAADSVANAVAPLSAEVADLCNNVLPQTLRRWRKALCLSNGTRDTARTMFTLLPQVMRWPTLTLAKRKRMLAHELWPLVWKMVHAVLAGWGTGSAVGGTAGGAAEGEQGDSPRGAGKAYLTATESSIALLGREPIAPEPFVDGHDLIQLGGQPGPLFSTLLEQVYDAQLESRVTDREQALAWLRERVKSSH